MNEEFVTLETAKALKDKGFDWKCNSIITIGGTIRNYESPQDISYLTEIEGKPYEFLLPTLHLAQKWLRENKDLHIEISYMYGDYWIYDILTIPRHDLVGLSDRPLIHYNTYEEALEAGLQEALKLI